MAGDIRLAKRLPFKRLQGARTVAPVGSALIILTGLFGLFGVVPSALTRPELSVWIRALVVTLGLGFTVASAWFGMAMIHAFRDRTGYLELLEDTLVLNDPILLDGPWEVPLESVRGASIDSGPTTGIFRYLRRFPIDRQTDTRVERRLARFLYTSYAGSPLPMLGGKQAPNVAILFHHPRSVEPLRHRAGTSVLFTQYGPWGADRPRRDAEYRGILFSVDDVETVRRFFGERDLLLDRIPGPDAEVMGATLSAERLRKEQVLTVLGLMFVLQIVLPVRLRLAANQAERIEAEKMAACQHLETLLDGRTERPDQGPEAPPSLGGLELLLVGEGPPDFSYQGEKPLTLEEAAKGRSDPEEGLRTFRMYQYRQGYLRVWTKGSITALAQVFEFSSQANALAFETYASRYACGFSNEAFSLPDLSGSIGLQIRYRNGTVADQVSFVRDARRYLVAVRYPAPAESHELTAGLARQQALLAR